MNRFWFAPESPRPLALLRIGVALLLLWETACHAPYVVEAYSSGGRPMPAVAFVEAETVPPTASPTVAVALHGLLLFALLGAAIGLRARASLLLAAGLLGYFSLLDFPGTLTKYTAIGLHLLMLLAVSGSNAIWAIDRWVLGPGDRVRLPSAWARRLMQLLVCHVYLGAVVTKIRTSAFATGETLTFSLIDDRWAGGWLGTWPGAWLATHPRAVVLASFATIAFEVAFPLLVWFRRMRRPMLALAVLFHLSLGVGLSLSIFTPLMLVALLAFVEERDFADARRLFRRMGFQARRSIADVARPRVDESSVDHGAPSMEDVSNGRGTKAGVSWTGLAAHPTIVRWGLLVGTWLLFAGLAAGTSFGLHGTSDPYAVFGGVVPVLEVVPPEIAAGMLAGTDAPAALWVHRIDVGRRWSNARTFGSASRIGPGETVVVQFRLDDEHPPLNLAVELVDPQGVVAAESNGYVPAGGTHRWFSFHLTESFPPGTARLRFYVEGALVEERTFEFVGP